MNWSEIRVHTSNEAVEPIANIVNECIGSGIVITEPLKTSNNQTSRFGEIYELNPSDYPDEGVYITFYLPSDQNHNVKLSEITSKINSLRKLNIDLGLNEFQIREIKEENWSTAWKKYYNTIKVTDQITINPVWENYIPKHPDEIVIHLDPGMAFGTGTHPTTQLSIEALEKYLKKGDYVIDVGCGSGVLSIISASLGAKNVLSLDLDEVAVKSTALNAQLNNVLDQLEIQQNDLLHGIDKQVNIIVSNILAEIIVKFPDDAFENIIEGGFFITSGIINRKKEMVKASLENVGFTIIEINELDDWISIVAQKSKTS